MPGFLGKLEFSPSYVPTVHALQHVPRQTCDTSFSMIKTDGNNGEARDAACFPAHLDFQRTRPTQERFASRDHFVIVC